MKAKVCRKPFENYVRYEQVLPNGRTYYHLVHLHKGNRTIISKARYIMCVRQGRRLKRTEHVDHIDGDFTNDRYDNLQVLSQTENNRKRVKELGLTAIPIKLNCPICSKEFERMPDKVLTKIRRGGEPCCSRSCGVKYGHTKR